MKKIAILFSIFCFSFFFSQKNQNYLEVGYASICCGTPSEDPVINYISKFQKKNKTKPFEIYKQSGLGREGEFNLYIGIDSLAKTKKKKFISGLKAAISSQNAVRKSNSGNVNFDETQIVTKADLANSRNLTIYKK
ncbi:hypothetical protein PFY10_05850 [Chryseobacterium daecheongense]|nr:hypothetical protein PFY10_05850 [Chryseobacterium daecheongense]